MNDLTAVYGPPWRSDPCWQRVRWAILRVGLGRGEIAVDPDAPREVVDWQWRPAHEVARIATSPWVEVWRP